MAVKKKKYVIARHYEALGEFLREQRIAAGFTQRSVSLSLGYSSAQFISNFERGIAAPPLKKLKILARLYKMPVDRVVDLVIEAERAILEGALRP
ncbi:MAG: XRE family transcriptional regulator [Proteobacteria bacterium]|nr:MAG: XRE family transcriptional regulator [Pseudomonadota bacterium]